MKKLYNNIKTDIQTGYGLTLFAMVGGFAAIAMAVLDSL